MSSTSAAPRAAVPVSNARAEASRQNGAKSRGPKTPKARPGRRRMRSSTACARRSISCCRTRTAQNTPDSRRRWSRSWRPSARCRRACTARRGGGVAPGAGGPHRSRAVRGAPQRGRRARARPDPGRQRRAVVRDAAALSRRGHGRVLARAAHAQGAPGRAGARGRPRPGGAHAPARGAATARSCAGAPCPTAISAERAAHARHPARARRPWLPNEPEAGAACGVGARVANEPEAASELDPTLSGESCAKRRVPRHPNEPDTALITDARRRICRAS